MSGHPNRNIVDTPLTGLKGVNLEADNEMSLDRLNGLQQATVIVEDEMSSPRMD